MVTPEDWTSDSWEDVRDRPWDLVVVGGGTAGIVAAKTASGLGAHVLLVERHRTGGDCLWTGCVPSKALLAIAHQGGAAGDFYAAMARAREAITTIEPVDSPENLRAAGVTVLHGEGRFTGPKTVAVDGSVVSFRRALVSTGSAPVVPGVEGIQHVKLLTSDTVWSLTARPPQLLVVGAGSIGCELGQAFARLGSQVSIVESGQRILLQEDEDAAMVMSGSLAADGITIRTGVSIESFGPGVARLSDGSQIEVDTVLVAAGRRPRTLDLGLGQAGVELSERGHVRVDSRLRTTNRRIWAAGDVTGHPQFTHVAGVHGSLAATNAVLGVRRAVDLATIPRVTYTQPEVAAFGVGLDRVGVSGQYEHTIQHAEVDRAITDDRTVGFSRLVLDRRGRIVGATLVGPRAGETLAELVLAARHGLRARDLAGSMHAYPTYGDGVWKAALAQLQDDLAKPWFRRLISVLLGLRRRMTLP
ncbi:FAD-dependent oxidoreductase [Aeromicrobium sp.]|uniref:dihydrolipoyl dehydrogenase family protein n=1 Tax=Aeromicrobium sp. TaxID=1871063 RepID=UPI0030C59A6D